MNEGEGGMVPGPGGKSIAVFPHPGVKSIRRRGNLQLEPPERLA
jgi:hypothetical protein